MIHDEVAFRGLPTFSPRFCAFFSDLARSGVLADAGTPRPVSGPKFQKKIRKNIESGLKQVVAVPPFEAISIAIDAGAPPASFSPESRSSEALGPPKGPKTLREGPPQGQQVSPAARAASASLENSKQVTPAAL